MGGKEEGGGGCGRGCKRGDSPTRQHASGSSTLTTPCLHQLSLWAPPMTPPHSQGKAKGQWLSNLASKIQSLGLTKSATPAKQVCTHVGL